MKERSVLFTGMLVLVLVVPAVIKAVEETENITRLKRLGRACLVYMEVHEEKLPPSLSTLYYEGYVNDVKSFASPVNPAGVLERVKIDEQSDYVLSYQAHLVGAGIEPLGSSKGLSTSRTSSVQSSTSASRIDLSGSPRPVIQDRSSANNSGKCVYVFYSDGSIRLKSGEVVSGAKPTMERPKLERMEAEQPATERPKLEGTEAEQPPMERPTKERPTSEKSVTERPTRDIPVTKRSMPEQPDLERPIPDKQSFDDYKKEQHDKYEKWLERQKGTQ